MKVRLEPTTKRVLLAMLASPKTPAQVSRIYEIPMVLVWQTVNRLRDIGVIREVFAYVDASGNLRRYFEAVLPVDASDDDREVVLEI